MVWRHEYAKSLSHNCCDKMPHRKLLTGRTGFVADHSSRLQSHCPGEVTVARTHHFQLQRKWSMHASLSAHAWLFFHSHTAQGSAADHTRLGLPASVNSMKTITHRCAQTNPIQTVPLWDFLPKWFQVVCEWMSLLTWRVCVICIWSTFLHGVCACVCSHVCEYAYRRYTHIHMYTCLPCSFPTWLIGSVFLKWTCSSLIGWSS